MISIKGGGAFTRQNIADINANFGALLPFTTGNVIYCQPSATNTLTQDGSQTKPYTTLAAAYSATRNGMNDVVILVGNGAASGSARVDSTFTWSNNATHLVGIDSPVLLSQRARIAPTTTATAFANFFVVTGNGCLFQNIQWFHGFTAGTTAEICMNVKGSRNYFKNCHIAGMADTDGAGAQDTGSRDLKIGLSGSGENVFEDCTIGQDTIARTVANASIEFAGATTRNVFRRCLVPMYATNNGVLGILGTGNGCIDRWQNFDNCRFINAIKSGSGTAIAVLGSFTTGAPGGLIAFTQCSAVGATKVGDANFLANSYVDMPAVSAASGSMLMIVPS